MKNHLIKRVAWFLLVAIAFGLCAIPVNASAEDIELTERQRNAIAMVNFITVLTQEINASKNSRLYMEEAYSSLINNTYPNAVDSRTQSQLTALLDIMESYRMIDVKRDRLQFVYEQNRAQAIRAAVPNPLALLSGAQSYRPSKIAASLLYMAVDSTTSYTTFTRESDLAQIKDGWALDDEEAQELHRSRKGTFTYMLSMVRDNNLPGDWLLTEEAVQEFVKWKTDENVSVISRIVFLENNQKTYQYYGGYWLTLAENYYTLAEISDNKSDYEKCLNAISRYESLGVRIFLRDYELAKILPLAISAADKVCPLSAYEEIASKYAQMILDNTSNDDWALRYFAAQTFVDLAGKTGNNAYLRRAYDDIVLPCVNALAVEQRRLNAVYLAKVNEAVKPKGADRATKKQIDNYNELLKKTRKTELPPVLEPLRLYCDLAFALANELNLSSNEKAVLDGVVHRNGEPLFLVKPIDNKYRFSDAPDISHDQIEYGGTVIIIPAEYVSANASITVSVTEKGSETPTIFTDWQIDEVKRQTEGNIASFYAAYESKDAQRYKWKPGASIEIRIQPIVNKDEQGEEIQDDNILSIVLHYETIGTKTAWYDYFKVWEGHKNNWYDYAKVWENSVLFIQVDT